MSKSIETKSNGTIKPQNGRCTKVLYEHQQKAIANLDKINKNRSFSTLVVLPTGGGKTYTAVSWLLRNAVDRRKKVLWTAHRQTLLEQAAATFQKSAYADMMPNTTSFKYRIISGSSEHDRMIDINKNDDVLIISKDCLGRDPSGLDKWLEDEDEIFLIIDEAHHSTAKTYRKVIDYIRSNVSNVKLIGLTATPFRTAENEKGLLAKIYTDGIDNKGITVHNDKGITYQISLKDLINRQILSKPIIEMYNTGEDFGDTLGLKDLEAIQHLDKLPESITEQMINNAARNRLIIDTYIKNKRKYGQTIVFAVNCTHAISLSKNFNDSGIKAGYIISPVKDEWTGATISNADNAKVLEAYRSGKIQVIVNVNMLTEGVDLPQTQTVFLTRPTVSSILMTQMIGRALRGEKAGGTDKAYIVSFIDNGLDKIAWSNPDTIFEGNNDFADSKSEYEKRDIRYIAISKIEEFAKMLNDSVDTSKLEKVPFSKRIPIGMYAFTNDDISYQVMVYDSTQAAYEQMMDALPELFEIFGNGEEYISAETLCAMAEQCRSTFFLGEIIPPYDEKDIINILKYYDQYEEAPSFYSFDDLDKNKIDACVIARYIVDHDMTDAQKYAYIDNIWENSDDNIIKIFFGKKRYLHYQINLEIQRIFDPESFEDDEDNVIYGERYFEDMPLYDIRKYDPKYEKELRDGVFKKSKNRNGYYVCALCGTKSKSIIGFHIDHIVPLNKGGKTKLENLQLLCRSCNMKKSDK